jgi:hypothetical protein
MEAVVHHLPHNTLAEDISDGLVSLEFDVTSVKQMTVTRRSPSDGSTTVNLTEIAAPAKQTSPHHLKLSKANTGS